MNKKISNDFELILKYVNSSNNRLHLCNQKFDSLLEVQFAKSSTPLGAGLKADAEVAVTIAELDYLNCAIDNLMSKVQQLNDQVNKYSELVRVNKKKS